MGITSKAFQKLNDLGNPTVQKSEPLGRLPNRGYGGLIRTEKTQHLESGRVRRSSAGELGSVAKAGNSEGARKGWQTRKGSSVSEDGFDSQKRWGNSAIRGVGVNSPAMMEARAGFESARKVGESWNNLDDDSRFAILSRLKMSASPERVAADRANPDHHTKEFSELPKIIQAEVESYMKSRNLVEKSIGKSLGVFSTMQALSKAGNSEGARKGWESRRSGTPGTKPQVGERVTVNGGGVDNGKSGVVINPSEIPTRGDGVPDIGAGHYKPVDYSREVAIRYDDGKLGTMFINRVKREPREKDVIVGISASEVGDDWETRRGVKGKHPESEEYQNAVRDEAASLRRGITGEDNNPKDDAIRAKIESLKSKMVRSTKNDYGAWTGD